MERKIPKRKRPWIPTFERRRVRHPAAKARASGWEIAELETGHDCHVERPEEVAKILVSAALSQ
jgi:hypothetical protein